MTATKLLFIKMTHDKDFQQFIELKYNYLYKNVIACKGNWNSFDELSTMAFMDWRNNR